MRIAFHAPLKAPDHPVPSGDRTMARLLLGAFDEAGHVAEVVSTLRTFLPIPDAAGQAAMRVEADREIERIARAWTASSARPDAWFTYHNHYKAPDLLGPTLARRFALPYLMAEASHAPRRAILWGDWHDAATIAIRAADAHLCFTPRDRDGIKGVANSAAAVIDLPAFVDMRTWPPPKRPAIHSGPPRIATVAMMRDGDKLDSYRFLAVALEGLAAEDWHLTIVGDGPAREAVRTAFSTISPERVTWTGTLPSSAVADVLAKADVYAWPGFGEAFGLSYLEAQGMGLPAVALAVAGVPSVIVDGVTGTLVADPTPAAYGRAIRDLLRDADLRHDRGRAAATWVRSERQLAGAAAILDRTLRTVRPSAWLRA